MAVVGSVSWSLNFFVSNCCKYRSDFFASYLILFYFCDSCTSGQRSFKTQLVKDYTADIRNPDITQHPSPAILCSSNDGPVFASRPTRRSVARALLPARSYPGRIGCVLRLGTL